MLAVGSPNNRGGVGTSPSVQLIQFVVSERSDVSCQKNLTKSELNLKQILDVFMQVEGGHLVPLCIQTKSHERRRSSRRWRRSSNRSVFMDSVTVRSSVATESGFCPSQSFSGVHA